MARLANPAGAEPNPLDLSEEHMERLLQMLADRIYHDVRPTLERRGRERGARVGAEDAAGVPRLADRRRAG